MRNRLRNRYADRDDFCRIAEAHPERDLLDFLGVTPITLKAWKRGRTRIPWAAFQLALDRSHYGLAERDAIEHFNRRMIEGLNQALTEKVHRLEEELAAQAKLVDWRCANDPFTLPTDPRSRAPHQPYPPYRGSQNGRSTTSPLR